MKSTTSIITALCLTPATYAFQNGGVHVSLKRNNRISSLVREMKSSSSLESEQRPAGRGLRFERTTQLNDRQITKLSVATLEDAESLDTVELSVGGVLNLGSGKNIEAVTKVLSASLMITGTTVGSSMFVLPDAVGGVGIVPGSAIFFGLYIYNLISGLLIADVAINLHESSDCEAPSSFKEFVDTALKSEVAGTVMAGASIMCNSCFLAFGTVHAGSFLVNTFPELGLDPTMCAGAFASMIALASVTQTNKGLEAITNAAVLVLFSSVASLLLPSMAAVSDPMGTILAPGNNPDGFAAATAAALPLILSSLTYQNIVPSITKLLDFDRTKTSIAIAIGSFIPMAIYIAWSFASLGGGLDNSIASGAGAAAFTAFTGSVLVGSCISATMSCAEEYESMISSVVDDVEICPLKNRFSVPAVALSMVPPVAIALAMADGGDLTGALHFNGAFITPVLYGLLPIVLYQSVQNKDASGNADSSSISLNNFSLPQAVLGAGTFAALGQEIISDISNLPNLLV